jgi:hypothetical protein
VKANAGRPRLGRLAAIFLAGTAVLVLVFFWPRTRRAPEPVAAAKAPAPEESSESQPAETPAPSPLKGARVVRGSLIGGVDVEKSTVCPGEDFRVSVRPGTDDSRVVYNIDGEFGTDFILHGSATEEAQSHWVVATDRHKQRDYRKVDVRVLPEDDQRCRSMVMARITQADDLSAPDGKRFEIEPVRGLGAVRSTQWTFGDGEAQTTAGPRVVHGYGRRAQDVETSGFMVTALVIDAEGRRVYARTSVSFRNTYYQARKYTGDRPEPVEYNQFLFGGGTGTVPVRVTNIDSGAVEFKKAVVTTHDCGQGNAPHREEISASELVRGGPVGPGDTDELSLELSSRWMKGSCRLDVELVGDTIPPSTGTRTDGQGPALRPVTASFGFVLDRPLSVAEGGSAEGASEPIQDPAEEAKLLALLKSRGTGYVTQAELDEAPTPPAPAPAATP